MKLDDQQVEALQGLIEDLKHDLGNLDLSDDARSVLEERVVQLEAQVESEDADESLIGEAAKEIEALIDDLASRAQESGWLQKISALFGV